MVMALAVDSAARLENGRPRSRTKSDYKILSVEEAQADTSDHHNPRVEHTSSSERGGGIVQDLNPWHSSRAYHHVLDVANTEHCGDQEERLPANVNRSARCRHCA